MSEALGGLIVVIIQILTLAIIARSLLSWFPQSPNNPLVRTLFQVTEPVLAPFRRIIPRLGMMDLSPIVAIISLQIVASIVSRNI